MKLAIVGSRSFTDYEALEKELDSICESVKVTCVVSGGAKGADSLGQRYAESKGIDTQIFLPDWEKHGKAAGFIRNKDIIANSDFCVAFWDGKSKGTLSSIELAKKQGIPVKVVEFSPQ
jgi:predicted Rossmann fold nucleotide-binding protein DprA/Smf involved in DNA uptake